MENLHECGFACDEESGYIGFLNKPAQTCGFDLTLGNEGTWGTLILAVSALVLLVLAISGLWIWWPRKGGFRRSLRLRRGAARAVISSTTTSTRSSGFVALPALFMWALTGINFELPNRPKAPTTRSPPARRRPNRSTNSNRSRGSGVSMT
jgi:uncharacterized iron-regulated membrane protein